jgi:hypothetical protein
MKRSSIPTPRLALAVAFVVCASLPAAPSAAATVAVPPLVVSALQHQVSAEFPGRVTDGVSIPPTTCGQGCCYWLTACEGPGYSSNLFDAAISAGDVVTVRIQAPPGKKFVVHAPASGSAYFWATAYWQSDVSCKGVTEPHTVTFENLVGTPPAETYSLVGTGTQHCIVQVWKSYVYTAAFEFTAFRVDMNIASTDPPVPYKYKNLGSWQDPAFGASGVTANPQAPIMEIVDLPTPAERTSWGRLKILYR